MRKFLLFFTMFLMFSIKASALGHLELERIDGVYSSQLNMDDYSYFSSNQKKYIMDGRVVYCVEPGINIMTMDYDYSYNLYSSGFSQEIIDKISLIGYFGYDYPGHQTDRYFLAAQELIWETIGNNDVHFTTGINDTGNMINISYEKNEIMSLVNHYYLKPSFDGTSISGIYQDEIVLVDKNNVLTNFDVISTNNSVSIDGNKLIIKLNSLGNDEIVLSRKKYDDLASVFYYAPDSQDFMLLRADGIFESILSVNSYIPYSNVKIQKTGEIATGFDESFIYENIGLDGVVYDLYASSDIYEGDKLVYKSNQLIEELITNDGVVISRNLPNGKYYLREKSAPSQFLISNNDIYIELENYKDEVFTHIVNLNNERKKVYINLRKYGETFNEIVNSSVNFVNKPLSGVKFGLFSNSDIYFKDKLVIKKDTLIKTFITDDFGVINDEINIPVGSYYVKELETLPGYVLDSSMYDFDVIGSESESIQIDVHDVYNSIVKGNVTINKVDSFGNRLNGACFRLFNNSDYIIYEGCSDSSGSINIKDLPYGKYHFYETSAPDGYLVSNLVYDFSVLNDQNISIDVINEKMPVTSDIYDLPKKVSMIIGFIGFGTLSIAILYGKKNKSN